MRYANLRKRFPPQPPRRSSAWAQSHSASGLDSLVQDELVERDRAGYRIAEPFLAEWILRGDL
jgi:hypothetical protein